jgi:Dynamin central region
LRANLKAAEGYQPTFLFDEEILKTLLENQISNLAKPSKRCLKYVEDELKKMMMLVQVPDIGPFENLKVVLEDVKYI